MKENSPKKEEKLSFKQFIKILFWTFKIYLDISPTKTIILIITRAIGGLKGLFYAYVFSKIIDQLISISQSSIKDFTLIYPYLTTLFLYFVFADGLLENLFRYANRGLRQTSRPELRRLLYQHLHTLGIQNLENPETVNRIQRSQEWLQDTFTLLQESVSIVSNIIRTLSTGAVLIVFLPVMIPIMAVLTLIMYFPDKYFTRKDFHWQVDNSEGKKKAGSNAGYLESTNALQEISIVGAYQFLNKKYIDYYKWYNSGLLDIFKKREFANFFLNILDSSVALYGYGKIFFSFVVGQITLGTVTFQMRSLDMFSSSLRDLLSSVAFLNDFALKMTDLVALFEMTPAIKDGHIKLKRSSKPPEIEFVNVSFKYPNSDKYVFKDLNLKIESGQKVALVGHNGAGKTTLVKLLSRIYQVTEGKILINGIDLNEISIKSWYRQLGVLFQDYSIYSHFTAKQNIIIGKTRMKFNKQKLIEASKNADAHDFISEYKNGYDTIMNEKYEGGIRASTGQQQKIAIARFFYRNAPVAIFDEPTSAIDAVSEYKIFNKIYNFFHNKSVVIISHRFSTVRNADRIIVIEKGKIIESGSHQTLVKNDGVYAHAFRLQAEGYQP